MSFGGQIKLVGETDYKKALKEIAQHLKEVSAEMKQTTTQYAGNEKSTEALTAKTALLKTQMQDQVTKVELLKKQYAELSQTEDVNSESMSRLRTQIANAEADINKTANEMKRLGDETDEAGNDAKDAANGGWTVFKQILADLGTKVITAAINGIKQLGQAAIGLGKEALDSYARYEQLEGGVSKLFGTAGMTVEQYAESVGISVDEVEGDYERLWNAQQAVLKNAENAYRTAGMDANTYIENVTGFSATLIAGLDGDTAKAAEIADIAIRDMADNANTFGTSMESITAAYQGFAKDNYTMLDNLKLGRPCYCRV